MIAMRFFIASPFESSPSRLRSRLVLLAWLRCRSLVLAPPPTTTECLEQCRRVGVARALSNREREARLLVLLLDDQQSERACSAKLVLALREVERFTRRLLRVGL